MKNYIRYSALKRIIDFSLSLAGIFFLLPVLLVISLLVFIRLGSPIFFVQERPGLNSKIFKMYKFRSMSPINADNLIQSEESRLSAFGRFLRRSSLDELPELFNVLKGDMSIVGPRPLLVDYLDHYNDFQSSRHNVRPGITGLAQVRGRNILSWRNKFRYDVFYVHHVSFAFDLRIIFETALVVLTQRGFKSIGEGIRFEKDKRPLS